MYVESGSGGGGFIVDQGLLSAVAARIGNASDDFHTAIGQYGGQECVAPSAFGSDVADAWSDFDRTWAEKLNATGARLGELPSKVTTSRETYSATESVNVSIINLAGV